MKKILLFTVTALTFIACDGTTQDEIVIDESLAVIENELVQSEEVVVDERTISYPIGNYETGILLKPFGLYVTSENSPVQPERFKGYHLGVDVEAPKNVEDVWVYAVADGEVLTVKTVNGYGGVIQIQYLLNDEVYTALYGHLDIGSALVSSGDKVSKGDKLAILGEGYWKMFSD